MYKKVAAVLILVIAAEDDFCIKNPLTNKRLASGLAIS